MFYCYRSIIAFWQFAVFIIFYFIYLHTWQNLKKLSMTAKESIINGISVFFVGGCCQLLSSFCLFYHFSTGNSNRDHVLGVVCGDESKTYVSTGQEMLVVLKGDNNQTGRFLAAYYSDVKGKFKIFLMFQSYFTPL